MEVYVLTGRTLGEDTPSILGVFSSMDALKKGRKYFAEYGYGDFDFTETSMDEY